MQSELQGDPGPAARHTPGRARTWLIVGAAAVGAAIGGAGIASAATGGSSSTTATGASGAASGTQAPDPATVSHGPGETLLTGTTAEKVKAAALAASPGATIIRVETDSDGSPYEAHITKADGTHATLKFDASFKVTSTEEGFGPGRHGQAPPPAADPSA